MVRVRPLTDFSRVSQSAVVGVRFPPRRMHISAYCTCREKLT
jgi:hypothetical protein